jgi:DNA-binding transcriptional LysR family regulator
MRGSVSIDMHEFVPIDMQLSAVVLAEEMNIFAAAQRLGTDPTTLRARIAELDTHLECSLFHEEGDHVEVTGDGQALIKAFRSFLAKIGKLPE